MSSTLTLTVEYSLASTYPATSWDGSVFTADHVRHSAFVNRADTTRPYLRLSMEEFGKDTDGKTCMRSTDTRLGLSEVGDIWPLDALHQPPGWFVTAFLGMVDHLRFEQAALAAEIRAEAAEDRMWDNADDHRHYTAAVLGGRVL